MATPARHAHSAKHQQLLQTPVVDADVILEHKENIKPLASGRRAAALADIFTPKSKEDRSARLAADKMRHTKECDDALDNDDDPLAAFVRFVDWTVDNYPQGECVESGLLELLELATRTFADNSLYKNDMRYLKLWILYASIVDHPAKIYSYLNTNEIGSGYSLFYEEYCNALERGGQRREAAEMYDIGIARRAQPLQRLQARRRDFNIRMMGAPAQAPDAPPLPSQSALGGQFSSRLGLRDSSDPFALPSTPAPQRAGNNRGAFQVYTGEDGTRLSGNPWPELESRDSHRKENHRSAVSAQGEILKQKITLPSFPQLDVYVDEGVDAAPKTPGKTPSKELAAKGSKTEALKRDPLRNFQQQPLAPRPVPAATSLAPLGSSSSKLPPVPISSKLVPSTSSSAKNKVTSLPAVKANELLEVDLSLYTVADGTELNPAEQRTVRMGLSNKVWPAPPVHLLLAAPTVSARNNQDTSGDLSTGKSGRHREMTASVNFSGESILHTSNTRRSRASLTINRDPTVTINTKEGLMDVYGFFNSPTKSMKLEGIEESVRKLPKAALKMVDFSENAGVPPTPTPGMFKVEDENAKSVKKGVFKPLYENETPGPKRTSDPMRTPGLAFQPTPSAGASKTPGTAKRGLTVKPVTPAAEPAPVLESQETDEDDYDEGEGALPDPETPFAHRKSAVGFVPFSDIAPANAQQGLQIFEDTSSTPAPAPKGFPIFEVAAEPGDERPVHEEDLFAVQNIQSRPGAFRPFRDRESLGAGDEDGGDDVHDDQQEGEEYQPESQEEPYSDQIFADGEEDEEPQLAAGGRWAPALTPITERTYEPTSTFSNRWTTPLEQRDQSVADSGTFTFDSAEAARAGARLAEELRSQEEEETRDLQRMRFAEMYRRESIGLRQSLGSSGEGFAAWDEEGESRVGTYSVREGGISEDEEEEEEAKSSRVELPEVVDPYTTQTLSETIAQLEVPHRHRDLRPASANRLDKLQKCFKTRARTSANTSKGSHKSTSSSDEVFDLNLDGDHYDISSKLGEGSFGAVFLATDVAAFQRLEDEGRDADTLSKVAIKVVKPSMVWESYALDLIRESVDPAVLPSIIKPHTLYIYGDESYLVLDYSHHGTLLEAVNRAGDVGVGHSLGGAPSTIPGMDETLVMFFAVELLRTVEGLHRIGIIHGDLKIDNCMVRLDPSPPSGLNPKYDPSGAGGWSTKGIRLIDFGRAIDTNLFALGQQFTTDWKVDKRDCLEMRQKLPWTYETDYYGLVGIVSCLLFGKYMEMPVPKEDSDGRVIQKLSGTLKRYWKVEIWEPFFDMLLNPRQFGTELPIVDELYSMRQRMEAWLVGDSAKSARKSSLASLIKRLTQAHI